MEVSLYVPRARRCSSIVLSHLLPILFVILWARAEPVHAVPAPQASVQSQAPSSANPPTGELTPPPKSLVITPSAIGIVAGEPQLLRLSDDRGRRVREAVWTVSDPTRADIKVDGDATITALVPGKLTVTATWRGLTAQARVTVLHSLSLYQGTAQMPEYPGGRPTAPVAAPGSVSTAQMPEGPGGRPTAPIPAPGPVSVEGAYFSDKDSVADRIISAINHTKDSLDLAIFDLTHPAITAALEHAQRRGVRIRIVADQRQAKGKYSEIPYLMGCGVAVRLSRGYKGDRSLMHDKFAVFDGRLVVTGSFNWTISADSKNFENAIFLSDQAAVASFAEAFERLWSRAP